MTDRPAERSTTRGGAERPSGDETAVRPPLGERISATVSRTADSVRTGARPAKSSTDKSAAAKKSGAAKPAAGKPRPEKTGAAKSGAARSGAAKSGADQGGVRRPPRRARLRLTRVDPWSVMKTSFLLAVAFGVVTVVSVFVVWSVLSAAGVWDSINDTVRDVVGGEDAGNWDVEEYVGMSRVMGFTMLVAVVDVVLITAIATLGAFLYNMSAALVGGVELTLSEDNR